jgi:hypothetical protein
VYLFGLSAEGETQELRIYGFRTGDSSRSLQIGCGVDAADQASFDGVSNYYFDGTARAITFNATDEDNILQVDSTTIVRTGPVADKNIFIGDDAGDTGSSGTGNVAIGKDALNDLGSGSGNFALGESALGVLTSGNNSLAIGVEALKRATNSSNNIGIGWNAGAGFTTGGNNVAIGASSFISSNGLQNVSIGSNAISTGGGNWNVVIGADAGRTASGGNNTLIGFEAGTSLTSGASNVSLGFRAGKNQTTISNRLIIDNQDRGSAANEALQSLIYGTFSGTVADQILLINGDLQVGNATTAQEARIGDGGTTDYFQVEADGTIEFNGAATVWDDFVVPVQVASRSTVPGTVAPSELAYRSGLVYEFPDAVDRTCYFVIQIPHTYKEGTDVVFHIHWTIDTSGAGGGAENVEWDYSYSASSPTADNSEQWPVATTGTQTVDVQNEAQHDHIMDDIVTITGTNFKTSEVIIMSLTRTGTTDSYGGHALLVSADVHHEIDTVGSRTVSAK